MHIRITLRARNWEICPAIQRLLNVPDSCCSLNSQRFRRQRQEEYAFALCLDNFAVSVWFFEKNKKGSPSCESKPDSASTGENRAYDHLQFRLLPKYLMSYQNLIGSNQVPHSVCLRKANPGIERGLCCHNTWPNYFVYDMNVKCEENIQIFGRTTWRKETKYVT
jgi:hypothetical protein